MTTRQNNLRTATGLIAAGIVIALLSHDAAAGACLALIGAARLGYEQTKHSRMGSMFSLRNWLGYTFAAPVVGYMGAAATLMLQSSSIGPQQVRSAILLAALAAWIGVIILATVYVLRSIAAGLREQ